MRELLLQWGYAAAHLKQFGAVFGMDWKVLPFLALVAAATAVVSQQPYMDRRFLATTAAVMLVGTVIYSGLNKDILMPAAALLTGVGVWGLVSFIQTGIEPYRVANQFVKPAWLAFLLTLSSSSLATAGEMVLLKLYDPYAEPSTGLIGLAKLLVWASSLTLWAAASMTAIAAGILGALHLLQRHFGNGTWRYPLAC